MPAWRGATPVPRGTDRDESALIEQLTNDVPHPSATPVPASAPRSTSE